MTAKDKNELRRKLHELRGTRQERDAQSAVICRHIMNSDAYRKAKVIAGYAAMAHEANITAVIEAALAQGKTVAMPLCGPAPHMTLRKVFSMDELQPGRYGIQEPPACAPVIDVQDVELILVPLEGVDSAGYRLGKGGGYYDCLLGKSGAYTIGCALTWQLIADEMPREPWDVPLSAYADMHGIHEFRTD